MQTKFFETRGSAVARYVLTSERMHARCAGERREASRECDVRRARFQNPRRCTSNDVGDVASGAHDSFFCVL